MRELALALLIGLASYRAWALLALDTITLPIRARMFFRDPGAGEFRRLGRVAYYYWTCAWCLGTWVTAGITLLADLMIDGGVPAPVLVFTGAAAVTALLGSNDDRLMESSAELG